jgi:3-methyl-2-oxobutanoate hydroxymethyltransferase
MATPPPGDGARPVTIATLQAMKERGEKIASLTAYDAGFAALVDRAGVDFVLVGDSLGMVVQGHRTTVPVTVDDIVYHSSMVARGLTRALIMSDLPFMSFPTPEAALANAARLMQEGGAQMVKLECHEGHAPIVERLADCDVATCVHLGLRPQTVNKLGGYRVFGRDEASCKALIADAKRFESAGADMLLLECVASAAARRVAEAVEVPVIGIGAGPDVDGQILVLYDIIGVTSGRRPRFAKDYMAGGRTLGEAVRAYVEEVRDGRYPAPEHGFS